MFIDKAARELVWTAVFLSDGAEAPALVTAIGARMPGAQNQQGFLEDRGRQVEIRMPKLLVKGLVLRHWVRGLAVDGVGTADVEGIMRSADGFVFVGDLPSLAARVSELGSSRAVTPTLTLPTGASASDAIEALKTLTKAIWKIVEPQLR